MVRMFISIKALTFLLGLCSSTTFRPATTPPTTTPPTTTPPTTTPPTRPPGSCEHNNRYYADGEEIERHPKNCYGMICQSGGVMAWDHMCVFTTPACSVIMSLDDRECCPPCNITTTPPTTIPMSTTPQGDCIYEGKTYKNGAEVYKDEYNCYGGECDDGKVVRWQASCPQPPPCDGSLIRIKGKCCQVCTNVTATTPSSTPENPGCTVNGSSYSHGQRVQIDPNNCFGSVCEYGVVNYWSQGCSDMLTRHLCKGEVKRIPGQCCLVCVNGSTPVPASCHIRNRDYTVGQRTNSDPCRVCRCAVNGTESCLDSSCDEVLDCKEKYKPVGECCYTCGCSRAVTTLLFMLSALYIWKEFQPV